MNVDLKPAILLLCTAGVLPTLADETRPGRLGFVDGDVLFGRLQAIDWQAGEVAFRSTPEVEPNRFRIEAIHHAVPDFSASAIAERGAGRRFRLHLANGDTLTARLLELTASTVEIESPVLGRLAIPREQVGLGRWIAGSRELIFEGPRKDQNWSNDGKRKRWTLEDAALYSNGDSVIGCNVALPRAYRLAFDVSYRESRSLTVHLGCADAGGGGDDYYVLRFSEDGLDCRRYQRHHARLYADLEIVRRPAGETLALLQQAHQYFEIDFDDETGLMTISVNHEPIASFRDPARGRPTGSFIAFASPRGNRVRLRDIRVHAWNAAEVERAVSQLDENGIAREVPTPLDELKAVRLGGAAMRERELLEDGIHVRTRCGSRLGLSSPRLHDERLVGEHSLLGRIDVSLADLAFIVFRDGEPRMDNRLKEAVVFRDGGRLGGALVRWDATSGLTWSSPHAEEPLHFPSDNLRSITRPSILRHAAAPSVEVEIHRPGNLLLGEIFALDGENLSVTTPFSPPVAIPRGLVREIRLVDSGSRGYLGPGTDLAEWQRHGEGEWTLQDGALRGRGIGGIGRAVRLADRGRIDLHLEVLGTLSASIGWFCQDLKAPLSADSYQLRFENDGVTLFRGLTPEAAEAVNHPPENEAEGIRNLRLEEQLARFHARFGGHPARRIGPRAPNPYRSDHRESRLSICWDTSRKLIALVADGEVLQVWTDEEGLAGPADGLVFNQHASVGTLMIRELRVSAWNGVLPEPLPASSRPDEFLLRLRNEDVLTGTVVSVADEKLRLESADLGALSLPLGRIKQIRFPDAKAEVAGTGDVAVRGLYPWGGECLFFLLGSDGESLRLSSPYFGAQTFRLDAFRQLDFDLRDFAYWSTLDDRWEEPLPPRLRSIGLSTRD